MSSTTPLKLAALDTEDLSVVSAHVQDAVVKAADIRWSPATGTFLMPMNRFAWETTQALRRRAADQRRRAVLHFDRVKRVRSIGVAPTDKEAVLSVLAITFAQTEPEAPGGTVTLVCAGDAALKLEVECIEVRLTDLGAAWSASMRPKHRAGSV
ncbi:DUF2948 family protein [Acuticoccus sp. MNP-M23]|uniref:DUF2948 family protein n=1 Tax=Acuticoccus sp. MNP-M23 TaxID=3072793 RepID=UPI002815A126|nr:DUF2948 family protein [Acuticoccus sp. MNP-M23]WMS44233.1 DUF2948 family protein [Acuticoccus sp. MNP-M23]